MYRKYGMPILQEQKSVMYRKYGMPILQEQKIGYIQEVRYADFSGARIGCATIAGRFY